MSAFLTRPSPARIGFLAATPGLGALLGSSALGGVPPWPAAATLCVGWSAFVTVGVFFPWLQMFGRVLCHGPSGRAQVALTFDDGPNPTTTRKVLSILDPTPHRATFFVLGDKARRHPDVIREIRAAGHALGVHGDSHDRLHSFRFPRRVARDIHAAQDAVASAAGVRPRWFRPPIGHTSPTTVRGVQRAGVTLVGWSSRGYDGLKGRRPEAVLDNVSPTLTDGAIVLLHDAAEHDDFEPASLAALPQILRALDERKLTSVPLDAWF
jgi:peptidoglycan/xylan/chitin deacetylase (PgdA/CDA1 family)